MSDIDQGRATIEPDAAPRGAGWQPVEGQEARDLIMHVFSRGSTVGGQPIGALPAPGRAVLNSSAAILAGGIGPNDPPGTETGLVAGYVQSGKTLSFTTVSALARDNNFHLVIVMTGTSTNLFEQSTRRIRADLRLDEPRERKWLMLNNPRSDQQATIRNLIRDWLDPLTPNELKRTGLVTVMKHHGHLADLKRLLEGVDLSRSPVLIIDDEADQASMNTRVNQSEESTTYRRICELRAVLPCHTFLQYTATPQAPLLINIIDSLSPNFVRVLDPGTNYVGGREIFLEQRDRVVAVIPDDELVTDPHDQEDPPDSLLDALRIFILGVAASYLSRQMVGNRSMLVHPSHRRDAHSVYTGWVTRLIENWTRALEDPESEAAADVFADFAAAHRELAATVDELPTFEQFVAGRGLQLALRGIRTVEVNTRNGRTPPIPWVDSYAWILVAGQAVDRGFTVEGLTVTYMPRAVGLGNADTLQQRGRFFGYKQQYIGYCRIYLPGDIIVAFTSYVEHEENIREQLRGYQESGRPLNEWKRAFILSPQLRPTRSAVIDLDYMRGMISDAWSAPNYPLAPPDVLESNRWTVRNFLEELDLVPDIGHADRTMVQRHLVAEDILLSTVLEDLILPYRAVASLDNQRMIGLMLQLGRAIEQNPNEVCSVYQISPDEARSRGVDDNGRMLNLYQGAYPVANPGRGSVYRGDQSVHATDSVTVQCHSLRITNSAQVAVAEAVQVLAVWIPRRLGRGWLVQDDQ